jgi:glutathione S-transferase
MPELILHHYPMSPFAEKIRRVLAFKQLAWKSVTIPMVMPKPDLLALTGGYRKTPVLQIGADIYCDTALICDVLEHVQPERTLYPAHHKGLARIVAQWADTSLFWAAMAHSLRPQGAAELFGALPPEVGKAFAQDRSSMRVAVPRVGANDAAGAGQSYLRRLANMLEEHSFLLGDQPCVADFAAYHPLWFMRMQTPAMAHLLDATPAVLAWMDRVAAIAAAPTEAIDASQAIAMAAAATPQSVDGLAFQDDHGIALGLPVTISGDTFGPEPTEGTLVAATRMHYTLRRVDALAGTVHVHLPRIGNVLRLVAVDA